MESLLSVIIWLVVIGVIFYVIWWGIGQIALPEPINKVVKVVIVLVLVLILVYFLLGILPPLQRLKL